MGQPQSSDEVQTPARVALAALERLCALTENQDRIHADQAIVSLRGVMHSCSLQLAALVSSASVLCDRLDELDAGDLCLELRAVRVALTGQRVEATARFLDNSVLETDVRAVLRRMDPQATRD